MTSLTGQSEAGVINEDGKAQSSTVSRCDCICRKLGEIAVENDTLRKMVGKQQTLCDDLIKLHSLLKRNDGVNSSHGNVRSCQIVRNANVPTDHNFLYPGANTSAVADNRNNLAITSTARCDCQRRLWDAFNRVCSCSLQSHMSLLFQQACQKLLPVGSSSISYDENPSKCHLRNIPVQLCCSHQDFVSIVPKSELAVKQESDTPVTDKKLPVQQNVGGAQLLNLSSYNPIKTVQVTREPKLDSGSKLIVENMGKPYRGVVEKQEESVAPSSVMGRDSQMDERNFDAEYSFMDFRNMGPGYDDAHRSNPELTNHSLNLYIFVVPNFSVVESKSCGLWSDAFYLGNPGYRFRAKLEFTTYHMGIFIQLTPGEFDARLKWPFREHVQFVLIDQTSSGKNLARTLKPYPDDADERGVWDRPVDKTAASDHKDRESWGLPDFVPRSMLFTEARKSSKYVRNDQIYIAIRLI
ncbi:hypothetical protein PHET_12166 [Paragonimus heterotremus]|uniref:MATH domain-containing protein n=1 Tax=Paragonimus heterotremus TaxID=100268 RepID=A0A8J4SJS8_9TREM|nr:hypothetical protein PHET_12166 [Paragonimus heterotremus]